MLTCIQKELGTGLLILELFVALDLTELKKTSTVEVASTPGGALRFLIFFFLLCEHYILLLLSFFLFLYLDNLTLDYDYFVYNEKTFESINER